MAISGEVVEDHHLLLFTVIDFCCWGLYTEVEKTNNIAVLSEKDTETINRVVKHNLTRVYISFVEHTSIQLHPSSVFRKGDVFGYKM